LSRESPWLDLGRPQGRRQAEPTASSFMDEV
jgi:hypothetical protein